MQPFDSFTHHPPNDHDEHNVGIICIGCCLFTLLCNMKFSFLFQCISTFCVAFSTLYVYQSLTKTELPNDSVAEKPLSRPPNNDTKTLTTTRTSSIPIINSYNNGNDTTSFTNISSFSILPLNQLVHRKHITGNVQPLMDFAVAGFAKCGSTSLHRWLHGNTQVCMPYVEINSLHQNAVRHVTRLHTHAQTKCDVKDDQNRLHG